MFVCPLFLWGLSKHICLLSSPPIVKIPSRARGYMEQLANSPPGGAHAVTLEQPGRGETENTTTKHVLVFDPVSKLR